jgi:RNA recognition motif-containing protein
VSGLPRHTSDWELAEICRPFGEVVSAHIEHDPETGMAWRFGFVMFADEEAARRAAVSLHGKRFRGDVLAARQVQWAASAPDGGRVASGIGLAGG